MFNVPDILSSEMPPDAVLAESNPLTSDALMLPLAVLSLMVLPPPERLMLPDAADAFTSPVMFLMLMEPDAALATRFPCKSVKV